MTPPKPAPLFVAEDLFRAQMHHQPLPGIEDTFEGMSRILNAIHEERCFYKLRWDELVRLNQLEREETGKLKAENARLLKDEAAACDRGNRLARQCQKLEETNARLREALEWYASDEAWGCGESIFKRAPIYKDSGEKARNALEGKLKQLRGESGDTNAR